METSAKGRARPSEIVARVLGVVAMVCFAAFAVVFRRTGADGPRVGDLADAVFDGLFLLVFVGPFVLGALGAALVAFVVAAVRTKGRMRPWTWVLAGPPAVLSVVTVLSLAGIDAGLSEILFG